jgi:hypothetical protein
MLRGITVKTSVAFMLLALCGCSSQSASQGDHYSHPANMAGSYFNQGHDYKTNMYLSADGKGAFLSINNDGSFKQLMTFDWGVREDHFYMTEIYFSKDRKEVMKAISDSQTEYTFSGSDIRSHLKTGEWIVWKRISDKPNMAIVNAISHI